MALRQRSELRDYQQLASGLIVKSPEKAVFMKPGLGKTPTALDALYQLQPRRTLVVAPHQVVGSRVWSREAAEWEHLKDISVTEIVGNPEQRETLLLLGCKIDVVSYDMLMWLTDAVDRDRYDSVVYDELQLMKHPGTKRFKRMRHWAKDFPIKIGLTGSPLGNHWQDLWGEMFMVCGPKALGPTKAGYLDSYFRQVPRGAQMSWELRTDGSAEQIRQRIKPHAFSLKPKAALDQIPKVIPVVIPLEIPDKCKKQERLLRQELEVELDSGKTLTAFSQSKLGQSIRQFASGAIYTGEPGDSSQWEELHDVKIQALRDVIDELQGQPILVFIWFKHEVVRIMRAFPEAVLMTGDTVMVDAWNRREIPLMLVHPLGGGRGLNLQRGSSSTFWFTVPWSRELFDQGNGRVARIGQPDEYVTAHLPLAGPIDRRVWSRVTEKGADEEALMESVSVEV